MNHALKGGINCLLCVVLMLTIQHIGLAGVAADASAEQRGNNKLLTLRNPYVAKAHQYKVQTHTHTTESDGTATPTELMEGYKALGYHAVCITDHSKITPDPGVGGILFIAGVEETVNQGHLTIVSTVSLATSQDGQTAINQHLAQGAYVALSHVDAALNPWSDAEIDTVVGFHALEMPTDAKFDRLLRTRLLFFSLLTNDDQHTGPPITSAWWVIVHANALTVADIVAALKAGNFYATSSPTLGIAISGNQIQATTDSASTISFYNQNGLAQSTDDVTTATYTAQDGDGYVRVRIYRAAGPNYAWSSPIMVENNTGGASAIRDAETERYILNTLPTLYLPLWKKGGDAFTSSDSTGYPCVVHGAPSKTPISRLFGGADGIFVGANADFVPVSAKAATLIAWIRTSDLIGAGVWRHIAGKESPAIIWSGTSGNISFQINTTVGGYTWTVFIHQQYIKNIWVHLAGTFDTEQANEVSTYLNGLLVNNVSNNGLLVTYTDRKFGVGFRSWVPDRYLVGNEGEVLYDINRCWTSEEIQRHCCATKWRYGR